MQWLPVPTSRYGYSEYSDAYQYSSVHVYYTCAGVPVPLYATSKIGVFLGQYNVLHVVVACYCNTGLGYLYSTQCTRIAIPVLSMFVLG